ncbi:hypothetical protein P0095_39 [Streptococcus phage P0095]|uniref:Uncharacterized protein n=1 Tax=Streptococcus phage P0095 TaxID=1971414 RepID=A0A286QNF1_9CAUD|nr:hypothetical protein PQE85_gp39 [Streptococcus phage P0095]ARU13188.1 hypothetical protein P0095_39 [Streptococcus phage P0095]
MPFYCLSSVIVPLYYLGRLKSILEGFLALAKNLRWFFSKIHIFVDFADK